jgi:hypothetical protein
MALRDLILETQDDLRANADHAIATFSADARQVEGLRSETKTRQFSLTVDEPPNLGGTDTGPNPVELVSGCARHMSGNHLSRLCYRAWHSARKRFLPWLYWHKAVQYFVLQQDMQAIEWTRRTLATMEWSIPRLYLAALLALNGNEAEARETVKQYLSLHGIEIMSIRALEAWLWRWSPDTPLWGAYVKRLSEGLRRAGMPEE